jgi:Uma2 family endonuclease
MATRSLPYVTPEQYLEFDRNAEYKYEYIFGEIVCMPGGSFKHNKIAGNAIRELGIRLSNGPCSVLTSDMRLAVDTKSGYLYPDASVVCGAPEFADEHDDIITNPKLVVEVLSPSTRKHDLGVKALLYLEVPSLSDLVIIEQDRIWIKHWHRSADGGWKSTLLEDPDGILNIESLNCKIPVAAIYSGVEFPGAQKL